MNINFFTEAGKDIGLGHLYRCLSLAQAFKEENHQCMFNVSCEEYLKNIVFEYKVYIKDWIFNSQKIFENLNPSDIIIIDSYKASNKLIKNLADKFKNIIFFDDFNRVNYQSGIIINGALNAEEIYSKNKNLLYLLGPKYQTLRKEFWNIKPKKKNSSINNILITFGGSDSRNLSPKVLEFFNENCPNSNKNIIIGNSFSNVDDLNMLDNNYTKIFHSPKADEICELMIKSDISICGAGQTLYELARTKTPSLFIGVAKNQENNIKSWDNFPYFKFIGWWNNKNIIGRLKESFFEFESKFKSISEQIYSDKLIINGQGSKNIVEKVIAYANKN